jgi:ribulose 1,5-bisphosphate synthetase/thiazole synthase
LIPGAVAYTGSTASFTPTINLLPGLTYTATVTTGAKSPVGIPMASDYVWTFNTGAAPSVTATDPVNLVTGVVLSKLVSATFSTAMDPLTITASTFTLKQGATAIAGTVSYTGTAATFNPAIDLVSGLVYTGTITTGAKSSAANIPLASNYVWTFTTGAAPTVTATDPANLATGVVLNKTVSATFSLAMDPLTITGTTFVIKQGATTIPGTVSYTGTTATFNPTSDFTSGMVYTATVTTGAKSSASSVPLAVDYVWTFTTGSAPTITSTDPANLATGIALNKTVTANFSMAMDPLTITGTTFTVKQGATSVAGTVAYTGTTATFNPTSDFVAGLVYTATVTTGAKSSASSVPLASDYVWTFTTGSAPTVTATDPLNLATGIALNKTVTANFSMAMDPLTITGTTFTVKQGLTTVAGTVSYLGTTATFNPTSDFEAGLVYTATVTTGAKSSTSSIPLAANYVWTFTTGSAPTVTATDPLNLATGIALNKTVTANFSMAMDPLTIINRTSCGLQDLA